jgi:hypothetical protein
MKFDQPGAQLLLGSIFTPTNRLYFRWNVLANISAPLAILIVAP